jgi:FdhD protein
MGALNAKPLGSDEDFPAMRMRIERIEGDARAERGDVVVVERALTILVNGSPLVRLQCLPGRETDLGVGFLVTEGLLDCAERLRCVRLEPADSRVLVDADIEPAAVDEFLAGASRGVGCGGGAFGASEPDAFDCRRKLDMSFGVDASTVLSLMREFRNGSRLFEQTGGVHAAALAAEGHLVDFAEDVGRHNAVDKVVGRAFREGWPLGRLTLLTSGRLSLEMALKAVRAGLPLVVSRSAPTAPAVEVARRFQLGLVGFARGNRMNVYSAGWRVRTPRAEAGGEKEDQE